MKNVLHLIKEYRGNYPLLNEYVKALPRDRYSSTVCYLSGADDGKNMLGEIADEVLYLDIDKKNIRSLKPGLVLTLSGLMKSRKIDIVHCHRHRATVLGTCAAALSGVRNVISHVHGLDRTRSLNRYLTNWIIFKKVQKIIAVSESVRKDVIRTNRNLDPAKVVAVKNGIDTTTIDSVTTTRAEARSLLSVAGINIVFGTVGRLSATKGQSFLLEAFARVVQALPHSLLVIIGEGNLHRELEKKAEDLQIAQHMIFTGYRNDVHGLLRGFDVFVLPSVAEGLSIALLEAMASRLPVIASAVGGIPEVINQDCGILVPARDPASLAQAMKTIGSLSSERRALLGSSARKRIEEAFTTAIMHKSLRNVYDSLP